MSKARSLEIPFRAFVGFLIAGLVIVLAVLWSLSRAQDQPSPETAKQWLEAVAANNSQAALEAAWTIVAANIDQVPNGDYEELFRSENMNPGFLRMDFNQIDFMRWRDAWFFQQLSQKIVADAPDKDPIQAIFDALVTQVEPTTEAADKADWPMAIWEREFGFCDRMVWVLVELAHQLGWETQVVYLYPDGKKSNHTVCELRRRGTGKYFADPFTKVLLKDESVASVAGNKELLARIWAERPEFQDSVQRRIYYTPAFPQDYSYRNQKLYSYLRRDLGAPCPRFAEDPATRLQMYRQMRHEEHGGPVSEEMTYWPYPIRLLRADLMSRVMEE